MRKLFAVILLLLLALPVRSATFSDLWWNPNESGWGVNLIEQQGILFVTLFVYAPDGRPTWYVGPATTRAGNAYSGALYTTTGPWFGAFFNPAAVGVRQVGTVTFTPSSNVRGTLAYSVDGAFVSKAIERQSWAHINLGGTYHGAVDVLNTSPCGLPASLLQPFFTVHSLVVTVSSSGATGTIAMSIADTGGGVMTFSGAYTQYGSVYDVRGTLQLGGIVYTAAIQDFTADDDGIRGNLLMLAPGNCTVNFRFAAVRPG